ncbi:PolC-type DNA polymerase III [Robertkochia solimangrovi]|uniref:3'-5' exonuclease n=1 Tax=Robertkochia solimangrovi TaxID=2213046 RepID=UPI0011807A9C|nr:3'-5' exonuclease [Robertkochia solimangrovi]TRZ41095.1 3'-5' exonuclease [Robertkochia solimangrovi]
MIRWFKKKEEPEYPEFWKSYAAKFSDKPVQQLEDIRFVVLDTETTGFDFRKDRMLCIGAIGLKNNVIDVADSFEIYIKQERFNPETVAIHGIIRNEKVTMQTEADALTKFLEYIEDAVIVAHHAGFDLGMINHGLKRMHLPNLKNSVLDTMPLYRSTLINSNFVDKTRGYSLDEVAEKLVISTKDRHTAAGDAMITAIAFLKILSKLKKSGATTLKDLLKIR